MDFTDGTDGDRLTADGCPPQSFRAVAILGIVPECFGIVGTRKRLGWSCFWVLLRNVPILFRNYFWAQVVRSEGILGGRSDIKDVFNLISERAPGSLGLLAD